VDEWLNIVIEVSPPHTSATLQSTKAAHPRDETIGADA